MTRRILCTLIVILLWVVGLSAQSKRARIPQRRAFDIHNVNFKVLKYQVGSKVGLGGISQNDLEVLTTRFGDLTGDGNDEAVVYVFYSFARYGGNGYGYFVDIFTTQKNKLAFLTRLDGGSKASKFQIKLVDIKDSQLVVRQCEMNEDREQFLATVHYEWNGQRLVEVIRSRVKVEADCWG